MHEDYVSFELAKKLKEKGFLYSTETIYFEDGGIGIYTGCNKTLDSNLFPRPTIPQVLKWLREKKKVYIDIETCPSFATAHKVSFIATVKLNSIGSDMDDYCMLYSHCRWEDAAVDGIEYALDNLI